MASRATTRLPIEPLSNFLSGLALWHDEDEMSRMTGVPKDTLRRIRNRQGEKGRPRTTVTLALADRIMLNLSHNLNDLYPPEDDRVFGRAHCAYCDEEVLVDSRERCMWCNSSTRVEEGFCAAKTVRGRPCRNPVIPGDTYCCYHHPDEALVRERRESLYGPRMVDAMPFRRWLVGRREEEGSWMALQRMWGITHQALMRWEACDSRTVQPATVKRYLALDGKPGLYSSLYPPVPSEDSVMVAA